MLNEPRVYKNSPFMFALLVLIFGILFFALFFSVESENLIVMLPLMLLFVIVFLFALLSSTSQTIISNDEISTKNLLGAKALRWSEISRVSGKNYAIKLHDFDGNVTVAPSPQLPGYEEIVEWIGSKRPDLFNPLDYSEMTKSWMSAIFQPIIGLFIIGMGLVMITQTSDTFFPFLIFIIIGIFFIGSAFTTPQSLTIDGNSLLVKYLLNQKTLLPDEVQSVELKYQSTRNGKNYFVTLNLTSKKTIRISGLNPNLPVVYLVLKNWHKKKTTNENSFARFQ